MTTTQTIDGVPLLPCPFCGDTPEITKHHREDIYGLMHRCPVAGAISWGFREDPTGHAKRWNRRALPAAHPQGEPAAWLNVATGQVTTCAVVVMDWDDEKEQVQSLYAEQPAPVAVVLPEREMYCQYLRGVIPDNRLEVEAHKDGWNACLDELKRLNPSL